MGRRAPHNGMVKIGCSTSVLLLSFSLFHTFPLQQGLKTRLAHGPLGLQLKLDAPSSLSHLVTFPVTTLSSGGASCLGALDGPWGSSSQTSPSPVQVSSKPGTKNRHRPLIRPCDGRNAASMAKLGGGNLLVRPIILLDGMHLGGDHGGCITNR